jgi:hypothetical protein
MILSFKDKRTREFAEGNRVKGFEGIERKAEIKLDQLEAAMSLLVWRRSRETVRDSIVSVSTTNGGFALSGPGERRGR